MSAPQLTEEQIANRRSTGRWIMVTGGVLLFIGLYISAFLVPDVIRASAGPQTYTLDEAVEVAGSERTYARLEGGAWDCDSLTYVEGFSPSHRRYVLLEEETKFTEVFFTDAARDVIVFVTLSGEVDCAALSDQAPSGYLYAMSGGTRQELTNDARLARYFDAQSYLEFCGYCGQENSLIGAVFGVVFALAGVGLIAFGRNLRRTPTAS